MVNQSTKKVIYRGDYYPEAEEAWKVMETGPDGQDTISTNANEDNPSQGENSNG